MEELNNVNVEDVMDEEMFYEDDSCDDKNDKAKLVVGIVVAVAGVAAAVYACKDKIEKCVVKSLRKKGYIISEPIESDDSTCEVVDETPEEEPSKSKRK